MARCISRARFSFALAVVLFALLAGSLARPSLHASGAKDALLCRACGAMVGALADQVDVHGTREKTKAMGKNTPALQRFTNPHSMAFEVLTVRSAAVKAAAEPQRTATFFENYAWQVATCKHCGAHLGWRYSRVEGAKCRHEEEEDGGGGGGEKEAEDEEDEAMGERYDEQWAVDALKGVCLEKQVGTSSFEWCYEDEAVVRYEKREEPLVLGKWGPEVQVELARRMGNGAQPTTLMLGEEPRRIVEFVLGDGEVCKTAATGGAKNYKVRVQIVCCDSYKMKSFDEETIERLQKRNLRLESVQQRHPCKLTFIVCHPKLCLVEGFSAESKRGSAPTKAAANVETQPPSNIKPAEQPRSNTCPFEHFYGLVWENILLQGSEATLWIDSIELSLG